VISSFGVPSGWRTAQSAYVPPFSQRRNASQWPSGEKAGETSCVPSGPSVTACSGPPATGNRYKRKREVGCQPVRGDERFAAGCPCQVLSHDAEAQTGASVPLHWSATHRMRSSVHPAQRPRRRNRRRGSPRRRHDHVSSDRLDVRLQSTGSTSIRVKRSVCVRVKARLPSGPNASAVRVPLNASPASFSVSTPRSLPAAWNSPVLMS